MTAVYFAKIVILYFSFTAAALLLDITELVPETIRSYSICETIKMELIVKLKDLSLYLLAGILTATQR